MAAMLVERMAAQKAVGKAARMAVQTVYPSAEMMAWMKAVMMVGERVWRWVVQKVRLMAAQLAGGMVYWWAVRLGGQSGEVLAAWTVEKWVA